MNEVSPTPEDAQRVLDDMTTVEHRVADIVDYRALATVTVVEGVAFATYTTVALFLAHAGASGFSAFPLVIFFILGMQLLRGLRGSCGLTDLRHARTLNVTLVSALLIGLVGSMVTQARGIELAPVILCLPGVVILGVFATQALREWRNRAVEQDSGARRERQRFTVALRVSTGLIGFVLGSLIATAGNLAVNGFLAMGAFILTFVWMGYASSRDLSLAEAWGTFTWGVFALSGLGVLAVTILVATTGLSAGVTVAAGAVVAALFLIAAVLPAGDD